MNINISEDEATHQNNSELLGFTDAGFSADKLHSLQEELHLLERRSQLISSLYGKVLEQIQKETDVYHLEIDHEPDTKPKKRRRRRSIEERAGTNLNTRERLSEIQGKLQDYRIKLQGEIRTLRESILKEELKRPDKLDLAEVLMELQNAQALDSSSTENPTHAIILSRNENAPNFTQVPLLGELEQEYQDIADKLMHETWFHTTPNLLKMIQNGGLSTQSWLRRNKPGYSQEIEAGEAKSGGPFKEWDQDMIYFRADSLDVYGDNIVAFAPEDILLNTGIFFTPEGIADIHERVISDQTNLQENNLSREGSSNLLLSLRKAYIAVPKGEYREICRQLLIFGYSPNWIFEHVFSYRGGKEGYLPARREIQRRIREQRKKTEPKKVIMVPNPNFVGNSKVFQLKSH